MKIVRIASHRQTSDPDDDTLLFSISGKPSWASFSSSTGKLSGTPTYSQAGTYNNIIISASDGSLSAQLSTFIITVENINRAPTISGTPSTTVDENSAYSFTPSAADPDGDGLSFSISGKPSWASFSSTGKLSGTPTYSGTYRNIIIKVSDGSLSAQLPTFSITVRNNNRPPTISGTPSTAIDENSTYSFTPTASDPDGDSLSFSISGKPSWASFNNSIGKLSGTPTDLQVGTYSNIMIAVSDGSLSSQLPAFAITVNAISNPPPEVSPINPISDASYSMSESVISSATAIDVDGSITNVQFRLDGGAWQIDSSEPYSHDFGSLSVGLHVIEFRAEDNDGNYSTIATRNIIITAANQRRVIFIHTDLLGSPVAETDENGDIL